MIYLDSWVWIEYFSDGEGHNAADTVLQAMESRGGVISTFVLLEVRYVLTRTVGTAKAEKVCNIIKSFPDLAMLPVTETVAERGSDLKTKYRDSRDLSYGDAVMLATATIAGCDRFYTGDSDFADVDEIDVELV